MWLFYPPVVIGILFLAVRHGGLRQLTASNPSMATGGLIDSNKAKNLLLLQDNLPEVVAKTALISGKTQLDEAMAALSLQYPIILKPNSGQRGLGVAVINSETEAHSYLENRSTDILVQEYIEGAEFGVFYMREPRKPQGFVFSITHKQFPQLIGDGESTLETLILEDARAHYMAHFLLRKHAAQLDRVLASGERVQLVEIGSHCRGSLFVDGDAYLTPILESRIDEISKCIPGYYFGRYDLRVPSIDHLRRGEGIKIIEANGLSSESTNIYDPRKSLLSAYRTLFKQWDMAFKISGQNKLAGVQPATYQEIISAWRGMNR